MWVCENCFEENKNNNQVCSSCNIEKGKLVDEAHKFINHQPKPENNILTLDEQIEIANKKLSSPEERFREGKKLNDEGKHYEAIDAFEDAILANYKVEEAYFGLHIAYNKLGRFQESQEAFRRSQLKQKPLSIPKNRQQLLQQAQEAIGKSEQEPLPILEPQIQPVINQYPASYTIDPTEAKNVNGKTCPRCGFTNSFSQYQGMTWVIIAVLFITCLGILLVPFLPKQWYCRACGYSW